MTGLYFRFFNTYVGFQVSRHIHHNFQDNKLTIKFGRRSTDQTTYLISGHLGEGLLELLGDGLVLLLLAHQLILQPVHLTHSWKIKYRHILDIRTYQLCHVLQHS